MPQPPQPRSLDRLTSLRGIAALAVFACHIWQYRIIGDFGIARRASCGVTFFFMLSGFVLVWASPLHDRALSFYRRRIARVYPSHLVTLGIAAIVPVVAVHRGLVTAAISATLTQAWFSYPGYLYGMNGVSWSLSCEAFFYLCLPLALLLLRGASRRARWTLALAWWGVAAALLVASALSWLSLPVTDSNPLIQIGVFLLGAVAGLEMMDGWRPRWSLTWSFALLVGLYVGATLTGLSVAVDYALFTLPFLLIIVASAIRDLDGRRSWLTHRWLIYAGQLSFCFYLVHELVIVNFEHELHLRGLGMVTLCLAISIVAAQLLHHGVELPFQRILRGAQQRPPQGSEEDPMLAPATS
ncbi:MAG TPA: acyltransferase [Solirubrobacteraceae bacterium]|jgi:peptidoglycan/LPS O-acetylase OafA/YrhL